MVLISSTVTKGETNYLSLVPHYGKYGRHSPCIDIVMDKFFCYSASGKRKAIANFGMPEAQSAFILVSQQNLGASDALFD